MQLKCSNCATPFVLSKEVLAEAIALFKENKTAHLNVNCPKCRRVVCKYCWLRPIPRYPDRTTKQYYDRYPRRSAQL